VTRRRVAAVPAVRVDCTFFSVVLR